MMNTASCTRAANTHGISPQGTAWSAYGTGVPIVLIHGVGMSQQVWAPQVQGLSAGFRVVVYDMLGHGQSAMPEQTRDIGDYATQLVQLLDALDIAQAHIVGHSMGALITLEMAIAHADRVHSATALNGVYCRTDAQRAAVAARARALAERGKPSSVLDTIHRWFGCPVPPQDRAAADLCTELLQQVPLAGYARAYRIFSESDRRHHGRLQHIRVPTLIATGELDPNSTPSMSEAMHAGIERSLLSILPGQRHMMSLVATDAVNALLRNFISQHT